MAVGFLVLSKTNEEGRSNQKNGQNNAQTWTEMLKDIPILVSEKKIG